MSEKVLGDRRKALEEEFFQKENERLRTELREKQEREGARAALSEVSRIHDFATLDRLIELGVNADTFAALSLVPLVEVAWANGHVEPKEREALERAARDLGIDQRHPAFGLFDHWLVHRPDGAMLEAWTTYVEALCEDLTAAQIAGLKDDLLDRARGVAEAAGGFLGLGSRISAEEEKMLGILAHAFEAGS